MPMADWSMLQGTAGGSGCAVETASITMHDGYQDTRIRLNINDQRLLVITESNIDNGFGDIGLQVEGSATIRAEAVADERNVLFTSNIPAIVEQLREGSSVSVPLRFWPSYPANRNWHH